MGRKRCKQPVLMRSLQILLPALLLCIEQMSSCFAQGSNPSGTSIQGPRVTRSDPPSLTTEDALKEMGLRFGPTDAEPSTGFGKSSGFYWPDDDQALYLAAGGGSIEEVLSLIRAGADVNYRDPSSRMTALMTVRTRIQAAVLLAAGADPNLTDDQGQAALHHVLFADEAEAIVRLLLASGADVDAAVPGREKETPLLTARGLFFEGRDPATAERIIILLMTSGANLDAQDDQGHTMLMTAVSKRRITLVRSLINLGADPGLRTVDGVSALDLARRHRFDDIEKLLIRAGARE